MKAKKFRRVILIVVLLALLVIVLIPLAWAVCFAGIFPDPP